VFVLGYGVVLLGRWIADRRSPTKAGASHRERTVER
jgi:hypothetical protein